MTKNIFDKQQLLEQIEDLSRQVAQCHRQVADSEISIRRQINETSISVLDFTQRIISHGEEEIFITESGQILDSIATKLSDPSVNEGNTLIANIKKNISIQTKSVTDFLITGIDKHLKPYGQSQADIRRLITDLHLLFQRDHTAAKVQVSRNDIEALEATINRWITEQANPNIYSRRQLTWANQISTSKIKNILRNYEKSDENVRIWLEIS